MRIHLPNWFGPATIAACWRRLPAVALVAFALLLGSGCAAAPRATPERPFTFGHDTFAYANELVWEYSFDPRTGARTTRKQEPPPDYTLHCFVVARSAKQFFYNARFDAARPKAEAKTYRRLVDQVLAAGDQGRLPAEKRIVIPGYADLTAFSAEHESLLKQACGSAWQSYFQRGHWRMLLPFSRAHQERTMTALVAALKQNRPAVVHVVRFPQLSINHALLLFDATESADEVRFAVYDPNEPGQPAELVYRRAARTFELPANRYFNGGRVDVYEIYRSTFY